MAGVDYDWTFKRTATKTRKAVHLTMVTSFGVKANAYSHKVQSFVTLEDLFQPAK